MTRAIGAQASNYPGRQNKSDVEVIMFASGRKMLKKMGAWTGLLGLLVLLVPCQGRSELGSAQVLTLAGNGRSGYQIVIPDGEPPPHGRPR